MKNLIRSVVFCVLVFAVSFSSLNAGEWKKVTPSPMESLLYKIYFKNPALGFASGANGVIYRTLNGGHDWTEIYRDPNAGDLGEIFFLNSTTGFVGGKGGRLLKTVDGGNSWAPVALNGVTTEIKSIYFLNDMTGWILASEYGILMTNDGGATWTTVKSLPTVKMDRLAFWDNTHAVAVGMSATELYYTTDGINWTKSKAAPFGGFTYTKYELKDVYAVDANNIYGVGWGSLIGIQPTILLKSSDGGASWQFSVQEASNRTYDNLNGVYFKDALHGIAAGGGSRGSVIIRTSDGGQNWIPLEIPMGPTLYSLSAIGDEVWVAGSGGAIMYSPDFGNSWQQQMVVPNVSLNAIQFASDKIAFAAGSDGSFFRSTDGGNSWSNKYLRINHVSPDVQDIFFLNDKVGYASFSYKMIAKTTDGGDSWKAVLADTTDAALASYGIYFFNELSGYVVGKSGSKIDAIYKTVDGGQSWEAKTGLLSANLRDVAFCDENRGIIVAEGLKGMYTADGGKTWNPSKFNGLTGKTPNLMKVSFLSPSNAVAVGNTCIFKSSDGGANWDYVAVDGLIENLTGLTFQDAQKGWAVGTYITTPKKLGIYQTNDGGSSWSYITDTTVFTKNETVYNVALDKSGNLWISGSKGAIFTNSSTLGVETGRGQKPGAYALMQNYPNPFNPSTVIEYKMAENGFVHLGVYDPLGRLVGDLVNEYQSAGTHKVNFDAGRLSSGVYFYSLGVNGNLITRKMSIVK
ncbi:MAG: T9SS type A sorting domain-containing protein [Ignavibacteria bacterium]|jgi:photosystem II stability/assembly factor-like uncharacterized protein|nr:T9SS type A sorting domain-containing protein [Ignavibacteria bacterium]MCU7503861.1 T9SS type A sorting domain-containing protein [Ignavibacteria bacterium]MCU7515918.1 T9SS type A sorting domain-containing protein [Ignavibacteria bacterium]